MAIYLITGASSGIGKELSRVCIRNGHRVYGVARREELLKEIAAELGGNFLPVVCDVTNKEEVFAACENLPVHPDVVILNAGVGLQENPKGFNLKLYEESFAVNFFGAIYFVNALFPKMAELGCGTFVAVTSLASYRGLPKSGPYSSSKAALATAFESMRITFHSQGINFLTVYPGFVATPMTIGKKFPQPMRWPVEKAAQFIYDGIVKRKMEIVFPWPIRTALAFGRLLPAPVWKAIMKF